MKRAFLAVILTVLAAAPGWSQDAKPNFSGTWNLDLAKSDFGQMPAPTSIVHVIDHKEPAIKVTTTTKSEQGDIVNMRDLTTDGKPNSNKIKTGGAEQDVTSTSKWDGNKLLTSFKLEAGGMSLDINDTWEVSADGKLLTITRMFHTPQGDGTTKTVYTKQ